MINDKPRILIVDDEAEMIDITRLVLEREGYNVLGAMDGPRALELIKQEKPDLILLDLMMPEVSGWEIYRQMKMDQELANIPVIVVTAKAQSIDKVLGFDVAKVDDYITKPFGPKELLASIERVLRGRKWE